MNSASVLPFPVHATVAALPEGALTVDGGPLLTFGEELAASAVSAGDETDGASSAGALVFVVPPMPVPSTPMSLALVPLSPAPNGVQAKTADGANEWSELLDTAKPEDGRRRAVAEGLPVGQSGGKVQSGPEAAFWSEIRADAAESDVQTLDVQGMVSAVSLAGQVVPVQLSAGHPEQVVRSSVQGLVLRAPGQQETLSAKLPGPDRPSIGLPPVGTPDDALATDVPILSATGLQWPGLGRTDRVALASAIPTGSEMVARLPDLTAAPEDLPDQALQVSGIGSGPGLVLRPASPSLAALAGPWLMGVRADDGGMPGPMAEIAPVADDPAIPRGLTLNAGVPAAIATPQDLLAGDPVVTALVEDAAATHLGQVPDAGEVMVPDIPQVQPAESGDPEVGDARTPAGAPMPELPVPSAAGFWERLLTGLSVAGTPPSSTALEEGSAFGPLGRSRSGFDTQDDKAGNGRASRSDIGSVVSPASQSTPPALVAFATGQSALAVADSTMKDEDAAVDRLPLGTLAGPFSLTGPLGFLSPTSVSGQTTLPVPQVVTQITAALSNTHDGATELALSPEELGHVRLRLERDAKHPDRMVVHITFERPETLDLFRRHAGELADALRDAGYSGADIGFGQQGTGGESPDRDRGMPGPDYRSSLLDSGDASRSDQPASRLRAGASLDLRL